MKHFLKYLKENKDDSPLYVFDSAFDEDKKAKKLLGEFSSCLQNYNVDHFLVADQISHQIFVLFMMNSSMKTTSLSHNILMKISFILSVKVVVLPIDGF